MDLKSNVERIIFSGLTPEQIVDKIVALVENNFNPIVTRSSSAKNKKIKEVNEWINSWLDLFPRGVKSGSKLVRSDRKSCLNKMASFMISYPEYKQDTIMEATSFYVNEFRKRDYAFMKCATYFISKEGEGSELAPVCDFILNKGVNKETKVKEEAVYFV